MSRGQRKKRIFKPTHELPGDFWLDYILLPYGEFYEKTKVFLSAERGDVLRFFNGPDVEIEKVMLIKCDAVCDFLSRMRYGVSWDKAFGVWLRYARMEGNGSDILSRDKCLLVVYNNARNTE